MMTRCTLVVASGPGREEGLNRALGSVFMRPGGRICDGGIVLWEGEVPRPLTGRWEPYGVMFVPSAPGTFVRSPHIAAQMAAEDPAVGWVLWLQDDEVVLPSEHPVHATFAARFGMAPAVLPVPISPALVDINPRETPAMYALVLYGDKGVPEPRVLSGAWKWPRWTRPSIRVVGWDDPGDVPVAAGLVIGRVRFGAPAGAPTRVNAGAGPRWASGWVNVDHDPSFAPDEEVRLDCEALPFADGSVRAIYASHMFDHLDAMAGQHFLAECRRVLAPKASLRVSVCDLAVFVQKMQSASLDDFAYMQPPIYRQFRSQGFKFGCIATGAFGGREWYTGHRQLYDAEALMEACGMAGFKDVTRVRDPAEIQDVTKMNTEDRSPEFWDVDDIFPDHTLIVEARG